MSVFYIFLALFAFFLGAYVGVSVKEIVDKVRARKEKENSVKESDAAENDSQGE